MSVETADTVQIPAPSLPPGSTRPEPYSSGLEVDAAGLSNPGKVRSNNEDHFLICRYGRFLEALDSNLPQADVPVYINENGYAMVVADGMGGHAAGEVASRLAINSLVNFALTTPDWIFRFDQRPLAAKTMARAVEHTKQIHEVLVHEASHDPRYRGFGTTLAMVWGVGKDLFVLHVGDSRVYLLRAGDLRRLTCDHTVAQDLANSGFITQDEVAVNFFRNHLSQCLSDRAAKVKPEVQRLEITDGDVILLCSDGLTDMVDDQAIRAILSSSDSSSSACNQLIEAALQAGGKDNITAVIGRYRFPSN